MGAGVSGEERDRVRSYLLRAGVRRGMTVRFEARPLAPRRGIGG